MDARTPRLLIAEDDLSLVDIYKMRFQAEGFEVLDAGDGERALGIIKQHKPDLVLLDLMMPIMSGMKMLEVLRKDPDVKDTKVVVLSALGEEEARNQAMSLGAMDYMVKSSVPLSEMVEIVRGYLNQR